MQDSLGLGINVRDLLSKIGQKPVNIFNFPTLFRPQITKIFESSTIWLSSFIVFIQCHPTSHFPHLLFCISLRGRAHTYLCEHGVQLSIIDLGKTGIPFPRCRPSKLLMYLLRPSSNVTFSVKLHNYSLPLAIFITASSVIHSIKTVFLSHHLLHHVSCLCLSALLNYERLKKCDFFMCRAQWLITSRCSLNAP